MRLAITVLATVVPVDARLRRQTVLVVTARIDFGGEVVDEDFAEVHPFRVPPT